MNLLNLSANLSNSVFQQSKRSCRVRIKQFVYLLSFHSVFWTMGNSKQRMETPAFIQLFRCFICLQQKWHKIWFFRKCRILGKISPIPLCKCFAFANTQYLYFSIWLYRGQNIVVNRCTCSPRTSKWLLILDKILPTPKPIPLYPEQLHLSKVFWRKWGFF